MTNRTTHQILTAALVWIAALWAGSSAATAADPQLARGRYLAQLAGCNDCHTPGYFFGRADGSRYLGGSDIGFEVPGRGVFVGSNLTPDPETGLGRWSTEQIVRALTNGVRPDGRVLATVMPWPAFAALTREDAFAIAAYLKSIPAVRNKVPEPLPPGAQATTFVLRAVPPAATSRTP